MFTNLRKSLTFTEVKSVHLASYKVHLIRTIYFMVTSNKTLLWIFIIKFSGSNFTIKNEQPFFEIAKLLVASKIIKL